MNKNWIASSSVENFWMSWRFKFLLSLLKKEKIIINNKKKIMDLGCGNGVLSNQIENYRNVKIDRVDSDINSLRDNQKVKGKLICYNIEEKNTSVLFINDPKSITDINEYDISVVLFDNRLGDFLGIPVEYWRVLRRFVLDCRSNLFL
jgi:hypothetical protein